MVAACDYAELITRGFFRLRRSASTEATFAKSKTPTTVPARTSIS